MKKRLTRTRQPKARPATRPAASAASANPRESFSEQLHSFFRRNMNWFLVAGFALLLIQDVFGTHGVLAMHRSQVETRKIQQEINQLDKENQALQNHVKDLKTDPATIECIAREDMGLARPGEHIFKTQQRAADPAHPTPPQQQQQPCSSQ
ncbi:MAG: septum formation initiator family protein [Candidatus Acidiferrales bacterium]